MSRLWTSRPDYLPLLKRTKKLFPTLLEHIDTKRIFLCSSTAKKSRYLARICPNKPPFLLITPDYDYAIESWSNHFDELPLAWQVFVFLHELMHVPRGGFDNESKDYRRTVKHDVEDFLFLRQTYGINHERVQEVLKGEKYFYENKSKRYPRTLQIK